MLATVSASTTTVVLVLAVFLAASVEMVEALTIVVAVGHTRGGAPPSKAQAPPSQRSPRWWRSLDRLSRACRSIRCAWS